MPGRALCLLRASAACECSHWWTLNPGVFLHAEPSYYPRGLMGKPDGEAWQSGLHGRRSPSWLEASGSSRWAGSPLTWPRALCSPWAVPQGGPWAGAADPSLQQYSQAPPGTPVLCPSCWLKSHGSLVSPACPLLAAPAGIHVCGSLCTLLAILLTSCDFGASPQLGSPCWAGFASGPSWWTLGESRPARG